MRPWTPRCGAWRPPPDALARGQPRTGHVDEASDSPAMARAGLLALIRAVKGLIAGRGAANGVCELDANARIPGARYRREAPGGLMGLGSDVKWAPGRLPYRLEIERRNDDTGMRVRHWDGSWGPWTDLTREE